MNMALKQNKKNSTNIFNATEFNHLFYFNAPPLGIGGIKFYSCPIVHPAFDFHSIKFPFSK
jgi:hypothetical protein